MKQKIKFKGIYSIVFYIALFALLWYLIIPRTSIFFRRYFYRPYIGQLNKIDVVLKKGDNFHLYVIGLNKRVSYSSTDIKVANVTFTGKVYGHRVGTTVIKVKVDKKVLKCRVRVIDISKQRLGIKVGESKKLTIKGIKKGIKWSSVDEKIAKVNKKGEVIGIGVGSTVIKGEVKGVTVTCKVTVAK